MFDLGVEQPDFSVVGVNHRTLALPERECLALLQHQPDFLRQIVGSCALSEAAVVSTCNRFEIVSVGRDLSDDRIIGAINQLLDHQLESSALYRYRNEQALRHLFRVASSLDSMVVGEAQILGQVKAAYEQAVKLGCIGKYLHHAFQFAFSLAKKVRSNTTIAERGVSISYVAVCLAEQIFGELQNCSALIIGSGKMAELTALHLKARGCRNMTVANRTLERALEVANLIGGSAMALADIEPALARFDIVIGSVTIDRPILTTQSLKSSLRQKPLFLIDLGVPRNFSSSLGEIDDVYLYNIDDLSQISDQNKSLREQAAKDAELVVEYGLFQFERWLAKVRVEPNTLDFRAKVRGICESELERSLGKAALAKVDSNIMSELSQRISQRVSHDLVKTIEGFSRGEVDLQSLLPLVFDEYLNMG